MGWDGMGMMSNNYPTCMVPSYAHMLSRMFSHEGLGAFSCRGSLRMILSLTWAFCSFSRSLEV